ncbi:MAG: head fiber protein [Clostridia bacterium]
MYATKNYAGKGGSQWHVCGELCIHGAGKLILEDGARVQGLPDSKPIAATTDALGGVKQLAAIADAGDDISTIAALKTYINALMAALRTAGIVAPNPPPAK